SSIDRARWAIAAWRADRDARRTILHRAHSAYAERRMSVLAFDRVSANYAQRAALREATAAFIPSTVTAIVGPNGSGKTTLFRVAFGILQASSGTVRILDKPLNDWPREEMARTIAYLPQSADAHWPVTARHLVSLGRLPYRKTFAPLTREDEEVVETALQRC